MPGDAPEPAGKTVVDLALGNPDLSTLVTALKAAGLVDTLSGKGPFTVFAPTNEAFAALPAGVLTNLLKPENKAKLVDLLTYHVNSVNPYGTGPILKSGLPKGGAAQPTAAQGHAGDSNKWGDLFSTAGLGPAVRFFQPRFECQIS